MVLRLRVLNAHQPISAHFWLAVSASAHTRGAFMFERRLEFEPRGGDSTSPWKKEHYPPTPQKKKIYRPDVWCYMVKLANTKALKTKGCELTEGFQRCVLKTAQLRAQMPLLPPSPPPPHSALALGAPPPHPPTTSSSSFLHAALFSLETKCSKRKERTPFC